MDRDTLIHPSAFDVLRGGLRGNHMIPDRTSYAERVFTNRNLRLNGIEAIGFDMDYTLAIYKPELQFLAARLALEVMVREHGYPKSIESIEYDPSFALRGVVVDKKHGNIFKMDGHRHVGRVFHGMRRLEKSEMKRVYRRDRVRLMRNRYGSLDTLFEVPETYLYARMVDMIDAGELEVQGANPYLQLFEDIRSSIDQIHRDNSLKTEILRSPETYIERDPELARTLEQFRAVGKQLFLLTNSEWFYTDAIMTFLLEGQLDAYPHWRDYFEHVVVFARKPLFFSGASPFQRIGQDGNPLDERVDGFEEGEAYQEGNARDFERFMGFQGDAVLYVGDHIYGDVVRSKKSVSWRTAMIIPEMEEELRCVEAVLPLLREREGLDRARRALDDDHSHHQLVLRELERAPGKRRYLPEALAIAREKSESRVAVLMEQIRENVSRTREVDRWIQQQFNPYWGQLFRSHDEYSAFGTQVAQYACVYTARVSNFLAVPPTHYFRTPRDRMPHERWDLYSG